MECDKVKEKLLAYVDALKVGDSSDTLAEIALHAQQCETCKTDIERELNIQVTLRLLPVKPMNENFRNRVIDSITEKQLPKKESSFNASFGLVLIVSAMIWLVAVYIGGMPNVLSSEMQSVVLGVNLK